MFMEHRHVEQQVEGLVTIDKMEQQVEELVTIDAGVLPHGDERIHHAEEHRQVEQQMEGLVTIDAGVLPHGDERIR